MSIIWCGGEPIDFMYKGISMYTATGTNRFRSGYARLGLNSMNMYDPNYSRSFGPITTSCWFTFRMWHYYSTSNGTVLGSFIAGLVNESFSGVFLAISATSYQTLALAKNTGIFVNEPTTVLNGYSSTNVKIDINFIGIGSGSSGIIRLYFNGTLILEYIGNIAPASGNAEFTRVALYKYMKTPYFSGYEGAISEIIVADEDTRGMSLVTHYPSAAGDTNSWTGAYTDVDEYNITDTDLIYTTSADNDFQCNLSNLPTGTFDVAAVRINSIGMYSNCNIRTIKTGIKSGGSVNIDSGQSVDTMWNFCDRLMLVNPLTSAAFTSAEIDALQINLRSAS